MGNAWYITEDHLTDESDVGTRAACYDDTVKDGYKAFPVRFKLYDDDDNLYYEGRMQQQEFGPLDWATGHAGCTYMKTSFNGGSFEVL